MYEVIKQHAREHVWCAPQQDYEHVIQPARLSPIGGWYKSCGPVTWVNGIKLPHHDEPRFLNRYHVYQIGQYPDWLLGVPDLEDKWVNFNDLMERTDCFVHCFIDSGAAMKATECWLRVLKPSNNIILAVEIDRGYKLGSLWITDPITGEKVIGDATLDFKALFIRFYTNARTNVMPWRNTVKNPLDQVRGYTKFCNTISDVQAFLADLDTAGKPKLGWLRLDGFVINREYLEANMTQAVGHYLYSYHDDTIISTKYHKFTELRSYESTKNPGKHKYIMYYGKDVRETIFQNDVEYFLGIRKGNQFYGAYLPRFTKGDIGMITHSIHCLSTDIIDDLIETNFSWLQGVDDFYILSVVRQGGMVNGLIHQHSRVEELYRLTDEQILQALQDRNSVMPEWNAANLEKDAYAELMQAPTLEDITPELVMKAYGYNAMTKYMQPQILKTTPLDGSPDYQCALLPDSFNMPPAVPDRYLPIEVVEYNAAGKMIGKSNHNFPFNNLLYFKNRPNGDKVAKIEYRYVKYEEEPPFRLTDNYDIVVTDPALATSGYACYVSFKTDGIPNGVWTNVTGSSYYIYKTVNGVPTIEWDLTSLEGDNLQCLVRIPNESRWKTGTYKDILKTDADYAIVDVAPQANGWTTMVAGEVDVWVDGNLLHEDLDYAIKWPRIYIFKKFESTDVNYHVRIGGLPSPTSKTNWKPREIGFVRDGLISLDTAYDPRRDRNIQITVGGKLYHESEVAFAEDTRVGIQALEGQPYSLTDYITPIEFYTGHDTLAEKARSLEIDKRVSDYMTLHLGVISPVLPTVYYKRWHVISVFFNEILTALQTGWLDSELQGEWDNTNVAAWVGPSLGLLDVEASRSVFYNPEYVEVLPHGQQYSTEVTVEQLRFLQYVNADYLGGVIEIEKFIYVKTVSDNG